MPFFGLFLIAHLLLSCYTPGEEIPPSTKSTWRIDDSPTWSPDGSTIAYIHTGITIADDTSGIYFIAPNGKNKRLFFKGVFWGVDWSPDGNWLAFDWNAQIYKIKVNGDSLIPLTSIYRNFNPKWSSDGKKLAFETSADILSGIYIINADGTGFRRVIPWCGYPDWVDESHIGCVKYYYDENPYGNGNFWVFAIDGSDSVQIPLKDWNTDPTWSPDGREIAFSRDPQMGYPCAPQIWVIKADGSNSRQLTTEGGSDPCWSPDGEKIVYCNNGYMTDPPNIGVGRLWIMDSDGSNKQQLSY